MQTTHAERKTLVIGSAYKPTLPEVLASLAPMNESIPEIDDLPLDDIEL